MYLALLRGGLHLLHFDIVADRRIERCYFLEAIVLSSEEPTEQNVVSFLLESK